MDVTLREVEAADLPLFFTMTQDPEANRMAAFTPADPSDRERFDAHWATILASADVLRTVLADGEVVGNAAVYGPPGEREVTYWIDKAHWGRGIASAALRDLLELVPERPLFGRTAADNAGSLRVMRKCGFEVTGSNRDFAMGRGEETEELILTLEG